MSLTPGPCPPAGARCSGTQFHKQPSAKDSVWCYVDTVGRTGTGCLCPQKDDMLKQFSEQELLGKPLSEKQKAEILAMLEAGEEDIAYSAIPEIREIPPDAVRGIFYSPGAGLHVPVYLDPELQGRLLAIAIRKGVSLSDLVSQLLRREIEIAEVLA